MFRIRRAAALAAVVVLPVSALAACGGDDSGSGMEGSTTVAPEYVKVPMAQVLAELPTIADQGDAVAAAAADGDFDKATELYDELHEDWEAVEGTVKDTDPDAYEAMETAQGLMIDGAETEKADRVQQGADNQREAIESFVAGNS